MKDKHRYILVESGVEISDNDIEDFSSGLYSGLMHCIGEANYHRVNPKIVNFVGRNRFIIKSSLSGSGFLIAALALLKRVNSKETYFYTLKTSGTIKALSSFEY